MPDFLQRPPSLSGTRLPAGRRPSKTDLVLEAILSPLGLGTDVDDPEMVEQTPEAKNPRIRAQALGDMADLLPMGIGTMLFRRLRGLKPNRQAMVESLVENRTDPGVKDIAQQFANTHPRATSHVYGMEDVSGFPAIGHHTTVPNGPYGNISQLGFNSQALKTRFDRIEAGGHEMGHHAQAMRFAKENPEKRTADASDFERAYQKFDDEVGYEVNPFEVEARITGLNQANRDLRAQRALDQALLPEVMRNRYIKSWSEAIGRDKVRHGVRTYQMMGQAPRVSKGNNPGAMPESLLKEVQNFQKQVKLQQFGSSPAASQQRLNFEEPPPQLPAEFIAVGDEPPYQRPQFKSPQVDPNYRGREPRMGLDKVGKPKPKLAGKFPEGQEFDISNLKGRFGVEGNNSTITLIGGEKPKVRITRPTAAFGRPRQTPNVEEYEISEAMAELMLLHAGQAEKGLIPTSFNKGAGRREAPARKPKKD